MNYFRADNVFEFDAKAKDSRVILFYLILFL